MISTLQAVPVSRANGVAGCAAAVCCVRGGGYCGCGVVVYIYMFRLKKILQQNGHRDLLYAGELGNGERKSRLAMEMLDGCRRQKMSANLGYIKLIRSDILMYTHAATHSSRCDACCRLEPDTRPCLQSLASFKRVASACVRCTPRAGPRKLVARFSPCTPCAGGEGLSSQPGCGARVQRAGCSITHVER